MCGFSGIFRWDSKPIDRELLRSMTDTLRHRGPDDENFYVSGKEGLQIGLGFRRLSIIDLSGGRQPMTGPGGKTQIVFNGEIYNFLELRGELEARGRKFATSSDTEIILHLYELYGPDCVNRLRGMFAFAIWDSSKRTVFLARDRIGKKPLFYSLIGGSLLFSSELKSLIKCREIKQNIRLETLPLYLAYQFIPNPMTIFEDIQRLPPAHTLTCDEKGAVKIQKYWSLSRKEKTVKDVRETCEDLRGLLREAVKIRLVSDVPLGAFLSGGIDSSAVVGMMAGEMKEPVKTFSIGFEESDFSELEYARMAAKYFRTDHHEFVVKPETAEILPRIAWHYDQPFADPSALPSYYVARETRKHVTVALNGDGGDESFGGYLRYQADRIFLALSSLPLSFRKTCAHLLENLPSEWHQNRLMRKAMKAGAYLGSSPKEFNFRLFCYFDDESERRIFQGSLREISKGRSVMDYFSSLYSRADSEEFMDQVFSCDAGGYLPDCLLVKMDIASMANSLEARSPFLDHKLMEFSASIPWRYKVSFNGGKWILKEALKDFLPKEILQRRKMGFGVPLAKWFRGPLKDFLREHLLSRRAGQRGYFNMKEIESLVEEHQKGVQDHGYKLWALLMLELWHEVYVDKIFQF